MECKTISTRPSRTGAFTLPEVMVASGLAVMVLLAVTLLSLFSSRSFVAMTNYAEMDQRSQLAVDKMSREIRQARQITDVSPTSLGLLDADNRPVKYNYDPSARTLVRVGANSTTVYLTDCDLVQFSKYQRTTVSNTFDAYDPAYVTNTRLIQLTWVCSRNILGMRANTEVVQSAKIALRNN